MIEFTFASMMICNEPKSSHGCYMISAYQGVWDSVRSVPSNVADLLLDELGNELPKSFDALQPKHKDIFYILDEISLFACVRSVHQRFLEHLDVIPSENVYNDISGDLYLAGFDVCCGNGWMSASLEGEFPNRWNNETIASKDNSPTNKFGLISDYEECLSYCQINNDLFPDSYPWYAVGVYITNKSLSRLELR